MHRIRQQRRGKVRTLGQGMLALVIVMFASLVFISHNEYKLDRDRLLISLGVELNDTVERTDRRFGQISDRLDAVAAWASNQYEYYDPATVPYPLLTTLQLDPQQQYYELPPPSGDEDFQPGNLAGLAGNQSDPAFQREASLACRMFNLLYPLYEGDTQLTHSHYISHNQHFITAYPYQPATELLADQAQGDPGIPHHNEIHERYIGDSPLIQPMWTNPWPAIGERGLAVYRLDPILAQDKLIGTLESEIRLDFIERLMPSRLLPNCQVLIIDDQDRIIAASATCELPKGEISVLSHLLTESETSAVMARLDGCQQLVQFRITGYTVQMEQLQSTPWYMINLIPNQAVTEYLGPQVETYILQIAILALVLGLAYGGIHTMLIRPYAQAEHELEESHALLEQRVAERTQELETLYEEIRATNDELAATNEELIATNEELAATNEELNSANEEINATNEELEGAYQQLNSVVYQLRDSESQLRAIFAHSAIPTAVVNLQLDVIEVNEAFCEWLGYNQTEACLLKIDDIIHPDDHQQLAATIQRVLHEGMDSYNLQRRYCCKDGRVVWAQINSAVVRDDAGTPQYIITQSQDITARREAEEALRESNERFSTAFHSSPDSITISRIDTGEFIEVNEGFTELTGYTAEEARSDAGLAKRIWLNNADREHCVTELRTHGRAQNMEFTFRTKDDRLIEGLMSAEIITLRGKQYILSITRDITQIRRSERQIQRFFSLSLGLMMMADFEGRIVRINSPWETLLGYSASELIGRRYIDFVHPGDVESTLAVAGTQREGQSVYRFENRYLGRDGSVHHILWSAVSSVEDQMVYAIAHDVTELRQALKALRDSGEQFRAFFELGLAPMAFIDPLGRWLQVNERMCELAGYSRDELRELSVSDLLSDSHAQTMQAQLESLADGSQDSFTLEVRLIRRDSSQCTVNIAARARRDQNGLVSYVLAQLQDITAAKQAEADLRQLTAAIHQASELVAITDPDGHIQYVNPAFSKLTGFAEHEVLGQGLISLVGFQKDTTIYAGLVRQMKRGEVWHGEIANRSKDGRVFHTETSITPVYDESGNIVNFVAIARDVTQQRRWEQQVRQSQKMEAIGTLAGGIAHDFNNILFAMLGNTEIALEGLPPDSSAYCCLQEVQQAGKRAKDLIKQILSFARQTEQELGPVLFAPIVKEVAKLMRASLPSTIDIQVQMNFPDAVVIADATQIHQIVMNLCTNAGQAMTGLGGTLTLRLDPVELELGQQPTLTLAAGKYAVLEIRDTGPGIDPEVLPRVFEPFFTTKEQGQGTGMGLAVVHGVVTELGGAVTVQSEPGEGAAFTVYLPVAERYMESAKKTDTSLPRGTERIMLVDDESTLVNMLQDILNALGYHVTGYINSLEALAAFQTDPTAFDLLFTDQTMPKLTGTELAKRCRALRPGIPVILCTGYSQLALADELANGGISEFIAKPLSRQAIAQAVRRVLDQAAPERMESGHG